MTEEFFYRGIEEIIDKKEFEKRLKSKKPLRIKIGMDPSRPDIHLGHAVSLLRLRYLQDLGHEVIVIIGDYTAKIGDPSGKNKTRPILSDKEIKENAQTYFEQVGKILDLDKTKVRYNSEWFTKLSFNDVLCLTSKFTVAQLIERDDFEKRIKAGIDVGLQELLYPVMQAYDSVVLESDVEFGGTDQKFNMLAGRDLQKKEGQPAQDVIMVRILVGTDGKEKMSKSLDNYIGISENANSMFGKVMSIKDELIDEYFCLVTTLSSKEIEKLLQRIKKGENPRDIKLILAYEIAKQFHGTEKAEKAQSEFINVFSNREMPTEMQEVSIDGTYSLTLLLVLLKIAGSNSESRRLIEQGGVKIDGAKIEDPNADIAAHRGMTIQVGKKRYYRVK